MLFSKCVPKCQGQNVLFSESGGFRATFRLSKCHLGWKTLLHQAGMADHF